VIRHPASACADGRPRPPGDWGSVPAGVFSPAGTSPPSLSGHRRRRVSVPRGGHLLYERGGNVA
jgi:hypothetical protein